jgi:Cys-tRNA(Pro)/Cys-tRNA(Cys) deacylase
MAKEKDTKTNVMRILDKNKIPYEAFSYEVDEFVDGIHCADAIGAPHEQSFKTLVAQGKSKDYFVFVIPIEKELYLKSAAKAVGEKSIEMIHVKDIQKVTGYIRGGCSPLGMKKQYRTVIECSAQGFDQIYISGGKIGSTGK